MQVSLIFSLRPRLFAVALLGLVPATAPLATLPAAAQERGIAAIVNRDVITHYDVDQRLRLVGLGSRLPQTGEARQRLVQEVVRALINERLQIQEAAKQKIDVTDAEVQTQITEIERRNNMERGGLERALRQRGIDFRTFEVQVRASIAWTKVVQQMIQPQIRVSDAEVAAVMERMRANKNKLQYRIQEIFLPVDSPEEQAKVLQTANHILAQLRAGASFEILARQFSQTGTAATGGDLGFLFEGQMDPEIEKVVKQLKTGQVAGPIRGTGGYFIIRLADRRTVGGSNPDINAITVARITLNLPPRPTPAQTQEVQKKMAQIASSASTCDALVKAAQEAGGSGQVVQDVVVAQQRPPIRALLAPLKVNQTSRPFLENNVYSVYMRCPDTAGDGAEERQVRATLGRQKLSAFADRYLKELRRSAYIDIRI